MELLAEEGEQRIPFDSDQVRSLIRHADNEWRGMILFGFHAGLRLTDCSSLTWANVDTVRHTVTFRPRKTAARKKSAEKETTVALHRDIVSYLDALATNDDHDWQTPKSAQTCANRLLATPATKFISVTSTLS